MNETPFSPVKKKIFIRIYINVQVQVRIAVVKI